MLHACVTDKQTSNCTSRLGTVLGFVISYRTTASFERYNEGRRYWSQIILASRTFARTVWFHVPGESISFHLITLSLISVVLETLLQTTVKRKGP